MTPRQSTIRPRRFRRPEYTGVNRCLPCTALNIAIVAALSITLTFVSLPLALVICAGSLAVIYFRGYLVPGTPALTKRYVPDRLLARLGKGPAAIEASDVDAAVVLIGAGVLVDEPEARDTFLESAFEARLEDRASELLHGDEGDALASLAAIADLPDGGLSASTYGSTVTVSYRGERFGRWESAAAFCLDVAGMELLAEHVADWDRFAISARSELVGALRLFVECCPDCGGTVEVGETTVESCCSTREIVAVTCTNCGLRVLELQVDADQFRTASDLGISDQ